MSWNWHNIGRVAAGIGTGGLSELANGISGNRIFGHGQPNPADKANDYLKQIPGQLHDVYDPYMKQGQEAYNQLDPIYSKMNQDPAAYLENIMKSYQPSQGYQFKQDQALKAAGNSAAAGGMRGSIGDIQNEAHLTDMLMGDDMQQWLQNVMGIQGKGMAGEQGFYNNGFNAANAFGGDMSNVLGSQATNAFQGQANRNKSQQDLWQSLLGIGGALGGAALGGAFGGGGGAAAAAPSWLSLGDGMNPASRYNLGIGK